MKTISIISLASMALAAGALLTVNPVLADEAPTNVENPAAMALTRKIAAVQINAVDPQAAIELAKKNGCFRCHAIQNKDKAGPNWRSVAERFRPLPAAVQPIVQERLVYHLVSGERANFPDGHSEYHKFIHTTPPEDAAQIKNLVVWLLSL